MIKHGLNLLPQDNRDLPTGALFQLPKLTELPKEYFVEPLSIKDQNADGNYDFCAGCAGTGLREPAEQIELFYPFLWAAAKFESGDDVNSFGTDIRSVGKALCKWGIPEVKDVPQSVRDLDPVARRVFANYPQSLRDAAQKHLAQTYMFISGPNDQYDNARANLWKFRDVKQQIIFGLNWGWDISQFELTGTPSGFGHAMWLSGWYEDGLQCVNSAGRVAGHDGRHKLSRETFNRWCDAYGAMIIVDQPLDKVRWMVENKIKSEDSWLMQVLKVVWTIITSPWLTTKEKASTIRDTTTVLNTVADQIDPPIVVVPPPVPELLWDTPTNVRHSIRVMCDDAGLSVGSKNIICATIQAESEFNTKAVGKPNSNGTRDWGICQINDRLWIGPGKVFASTDQVLNEPELSVKFMINQYKRGNIRWWMAFVNGSYKKFL